MFGLKVCFIFYAKIQNVFGFLQSDYLTNVYSESDLVDLEIIKTEIRLK